MIKLMKARDVLNNNLTAQMKGRRRKMLTTLLAMSLIVSGATLSSLASTAMPAVAATTNLTTAADTRMLALQVAASAFPSGATRAVVVPSNSENIIAQGSALSSNLGIPLVVSRTTGSSAEVLADVQARGASRVILLGTEASYTPAFVTSVGAALTIDNRVAVASDFERSAQIEAIGNFSELVIVKSQNRPQARLGSLYAAANGYAIAFVDGSQSSPSLTALISRFSNEAVTIIGDASIVSSAFPEAQSSAFKYLDTTDLIQSELKTAYSRVGSGARANDVVIAPSDQFVSSVLAGTLAHSRSGIAISAGPAVTINSLSAGIEYQRLWGAETYRLSLVGLNLTSTHLTAVSSAANVPRSPLPAWRFAGTAPGATTWSQSFTALPSATRYSMFDLFGEQIATSISSPMTIPGSPRAAVLVALGANGAELGRLEYRVNQYLGISDQDTAVSSQARNGVNSLQFASLIKTPRLITRTTQDPFAEVPVSTTSVIAITCLGYFTDTGLDATKQYAYDVQTLSGASNRACDSAAPLTPTSFGTLKSSAVELPPTSFPAFGRTSDQGRRSVQPVAASPTLMDSVLMASKGESNLFTEEMPLASPASQSARAGGTNVSIRYQAYIQERLIPYPLYSGNPLLPLVAFGGDNRPTGQSYGAYRYQIDTNFYFSNMGLRQIVTSTTSIGVTKKYFCNLGVSCTLQASATQNPNSVRLQSSSINGVLASARVIADSNNPLASVSQPINADLSFKLIPGASTITGTHDRMPTHEIFFGVLPGEYVSSYVSKTAEPQCLFEGVPGCKVTLNRSL